MDLAMDNADTLTVEEVLYAATLFESNDDQLKVYQAASRVHANDWRGPNNEGGSWWPWASSARQPTASWRPTSAGTTRSSTTTSAPWPA